MRQNVVLFSILAVGAVYILYVSEETPVPLDESELQTDDQEEEIQPTGYHTRKLLFHTATESEPNQAGEEPLSPRDIRPLRRNMPQNLKKDKKSRRKKRRVPNEQFSWKFNVSVKRQGDGIPNKNEYPVDDSKDKYLGMSMSVSGNGPDQSVEELYQAWESVGLFLRSLFGGSLEELKDKGHGVSVEVSPNGTKTMPVELFVEGSGEEDTQEGRDRKGKFLLGIFGFGTNQENPPRDEGSGEALDLQEANSTELILNNQPPNKSESTEASNNKEVVKIVTETGDLKETETSDPIEGFQEANITELLPNRQSPDDSKNTDVSNDDKEVTSIEIKDFKETATSDSKEEIPITNLEVTIPVTPNTAMFEEAILEKNNCTDCENTEPTNGIIATEDSSTFFGSVSNTISPQFPFSSEALKDFCNAMLARMRKSPQSMQRSAGDEGSGSFAIDEINSSELSFSTGASNILTDKPTIQNEGFIERIWNRILGRKIPPVHEVVKESRGARFINLSNLFGGLGGSGREAGEASNIEFDNFDVDEIEGDSEQFLSDCEAFLLSVQTENRPNIFDLVNPHTENEFTNESTATENEKSHFSGLETVISTNVEEVSLEFESTSQENGLTTMAMIREIDFNNKVSTNSPSNSQLTTEVQGNLPFIEDEIKNIEVSTPIEQLVTEVEKKSENGSLNVRNLFMETTEIQSTQNSDLSSFANSVETESATKDLADQRTLNFFGFGSGVEESSDEGSGAIAERTFGFIILGSGERDLKISEVPIEDTTEGSQERRFFSIFGFGSGGRELVSLNSSEMETTEDLVTSSTPSKGRVFDFIGFGSGERELRDTLEFTTENGETQTALFTTSVKPIIYTRNPVDTDSTPEVTLDQDIYSKTTLSSDVDKSSETSTKTDEPQGKTIFGLNIFGSGDGRDISEVLTETEDSNCMDCYSGNDTSADCNDCNINANDSDIFISTIMTTSNISVESFDNQACIDCEVTSSEENGVATVSNSDGPSLTTRPTEEENYPDPNTTTPECTTVMDEHLSKPTKQENDASIETPQVTTTEQNDPRLIGTIFLTGSGEGGLFVDNKGPINLVQESEFTTLNILQQFPKKGRGARFLEPDYDIPQFERLPEATDKSRTPNLVTPQNTVDINVNEVMDETATDLESFTIVTSHEPEIEDTTSLPSKTLKDESNSTDTTDPSKQNTTVFDATTIAYPTVNATEIVFSTTTLKLTPRIKATEPTVRFCNSASECNRTLNERCITKGKAAVCNCGRSYVRSRGTGKCESPVVLKTSLKLPGEVYHKDLKDRNSERFQKKRNDSIETMFLLLGDDPALFHVVSGIDVSSFESGSLVVHWQISLAPSNSTPDVPALIDRVDAGLKEAFEDEALVEKTPLNVQDAVLMAVTSDTGLCERSELNYCSRNAACLPDETRGFVCRCKEDFVDKSADAEHPGEVCIASCPPDYCGEHGECMLKNDGNLHCSCHGWYFGDRCRIPGVIVIAGFASFNVLLIIVVIVLVCVCKKRRCRQSRFYGQNQVRFQPDTEMGRFTASPRLADTLAMGEMGGPTKMRKYMAISTPLPQHSAAVPAIQISSPSVMGSSVDFDYDSTFDRTPSAGEVTAEVHNSRDTPKV